MYSVKTDWTKCVSGYEPRFVFVVIHEIRKQTKRLSNLMNLKKSCLWTETPFMHVIYQLIVRKSNCWKSKIIRTRKQGLIKSFTLEDANHFRFKFRHLVSSEVMMENNQFINNWWWKVFQYKAVFDINQI